LFCANEEKFSFCWIEKQFENVIDSGGKCFKRLNRICRSERDVLQLGVISVEMIFEGFFEITEPSGRSCIESKTEVGQVRNLGVHHRKELRMQRLNHRLRLPESEVRDKTEEKQSRDRPSRPNQFQRRVRTME